MKRKALQGLLSIANRMVATERQERGKKWERAARREAYLCSLQASLREDH